MAMVGEMIWATIDLSQINFYRLHHANNAHLVLNQCKLIRLLKSIIYIRINSCLSSGNIAQEVQLINDGCPMFDFVAIQSHKGKAQTTSVFIPYFTKMISGPQIHFSTRVLRFRQDYAINQQITLGCSLTVKTTDEPPLC